MDFWKNVTRGGERPFLIGRSESVTYDRLRGLVASALADLDDRRIPAGERIAIVLRDEPKAIATFAASLFRGLVPIMLPFDIGRPRLEAICRSIEPALVVSEETFISTRVVTEVELTHVARNDLAYLLFTSGTTAAPSGVEITRHNLCSHLDTLIRIFNFGAQTRVFNPTPVSHTDGLIFGPLLALATGGAVIRPGPMQLAEFETWIDMARLTGATHMMTNPTVLSLIDRSASRTDYFSFEGFQGILSGGSLLRTELWLRFEERFHTQIWNLYGLTETVTSVLYSGRHPEMGPIGTLGKAIDCEARIAPPLNDGKVVLASNVGELQVRGPHIFRGYWRNPERTSATFVDESWMRTGDLVRANANGSYDFLGRIKSAINSGGTLICAEEIDECLLHHPAVAEAATVGLPDNEFEEVAVSAVVPRLNATIFESDLTAHCRSELEVLKVPKRIIVVDAIPRGDAGKPNLQAVRELLAMNVRASSQLSGNDGDDIDSSLIELAALVFGAEQASLSVASTPQSVEGWDSFRHVNLVLQAEELFSIRVPGKLVGQITSLGDLSNIIRKARTGIPQRQLRPTNEL